MQRCLQDWHPVPGHLQHNLFTSVGIHLGGLCGQMAQHSPIHTSRQSPAVLYGLVLSDHWDRAVASARPWDMPRFCREEDWWLQVTTANKTKQTLQVCALSWCSPHRDAARQISWAQTQLHPGYWCDHCHPQVQIFIGSESQKSTHRHHFPKSVLGRICWRSLLVIPGPKYPTRSKTLPGSQNKLTRLSSLKNFAESSHGNKKKKIFSQYLESPNPTVGDACEEGKERIRRSTALPLLRGEAKPPRWPPHATPAWARCVLELDLGIAWVSQAEGLGNRGKALPAVSLPRSSHFVH